REATESAPPALQPAFPPQAATLRAEPHGPRRDPRRRPAPQRRATAPRPGGRRPARSRCDPAPGIPRAGRGRVGAHPGTAPLTESVLPAGAPVVTELRCQCLQTVQGIHLKNIQSVKVTPPGPHCGQTEVVATLKTGQEVCLNPEAPMVKKIINKMLNK
uniref:C-X-C motif chemokine n=2 Tax=Phocoenidae TaxID=9740 RepID=A0A8C9BXD5_PHOSS